MKTRVTFRVDDRLAVALRELPNQTKFVEDALRDALGKTCPVCHGEGLLRAHGIRVTNVRKQGIKGLNRNEAQQLQRVYRLGQQVAATRIELQKVGGSVTFTMRRGEHALLNGILNPTGMYQ